MKLTASGGTDGANIVLFWPDNLPIDSDALLQDDPIDLVEKLRGEGKLIWFLCDGDGGYSVGIYVRTSVPEGLMALCRDEEHYPTLEVKGDGYFGGMEYMFKDDSSFLEKYPGMCEKVLIPEGTYSARIYRTDVPEGLYESWLIEQVGIVAKRLWDLHGILAGCSIVGVLASLVSIFFVSWTTWFYIVLGTAVFILSGTVLSRTGKFKAAARANQEFASEYPSYVVHLE